MSSEGWLRQERQQAREAATGPGELCVAWRGDSHGRSPFSTESVQALGGIRGFPRRIRDPAAPPSIFYLFLFCSMYKFCFQFFSITLDLPIFLPKFFSCFYILCNFDQKFFFQNLFPNLIPFYNFFHNFCYQFFFFPMFSAIKFLFAFSFLFCSMYKFCSQFFF